MPLHQEIDEDIGEFLRRSVGGVRVYRGVLRSQSLSVLAHESLRHGIFVGKEAVERTDLRIGPRGDLRHRRRLESPLLEYSRGSLKQSGDALAADVALWLQGRTILA